MIQCPAGTPPSLRRPWPSVSARTPLLASCHAPNPAPNLHRTPPPPPTYPGALRPPPTRHAQPRLATEALEPPCGPVRPSQRHGSPASPAVLRHGRVSSAPARVAPRVVPQWLWPRVALCQVRGTEAAEGWRGRDCGLLGSGDASWYRAWRGMASRRMVFP